MKIPLSDIKNHANDFTVDHYLELLIIAQKKYHFVFYDEIDSVKNCILWRHDCDYSLNRAHRLGMIENSLGIKSTFFINPHCYFYNILEKNQTKIINKILNLGHRLGLHFDTEYYEIDREDKLNDYISDEQSMLEKLFKTKIDVFSFHNPTNYILDNFQDDKYGGMINCYSKTFKENIAYCSDSNGYWRHQRIYDFLITNDKSKAQVLTHPGWWLDNITQPRDRILRAVNGRRDHAMKLYDDELKKFNRKNVT